MPLWSLAGEAFGSFCHQSRKISFEDSDLQSIAKGANKNINKKEIFQKPSIYIR
ncbi:hypothetical protein [Azospirillum doebereinerae]